MSVKLEKEKAKNLRKSRWWQTLIANSSCYYCSKKLSKVEATMDHVVPLSRGGRSNRGNIVVACKACNTKKKDTTATEFLSRKEKLFYF